MRIHDLTDPADQSHLRDLLARATDTEGFAVETRSVQSDGRACGSAAMSSPFSTTRVPCVI